jgi:hypothetical protein
MKKFIILLMGLTIFLFNIVVLGDECAHVHNTHNVTHQFYEALIQTPKDAIVKGAVATKDLGKDVAIAVYNSDAPAELKNAAKELVIEAPVKTGIAIKNGALKAVEGVKKGAKAAYNVVIRKPIHKIKDTAHTIANSEFVQETKQEISDLGGQFADAGNDVVQATKSGAQKVYTVMVQKPIGAVKAAAHYLAHGDEHEHKEHQTETEQNICVLVLPAPFASPHTASFESRPTNLTTIAVVPLSLVNGSVKVVAADDSGESDEEIDLEFIMDTPCQLTEDRYELSEKTVKRLAKAYQSIKDDILIV